MNCRLYVRKVDRNWLPRLTQLCNLPHPHRRSGAVAVAVAVADARSRPAGEDQSLSQRFDVNKPD